jgi:hypothetical protein
VFFVKILSGKQGIGLSEPFASFLTLALQVLAFRFEVGFDCWEPKLRGPVQCLLDTV